MATVDFGIRARVWCFVTCRSPSGQAQCLRHWSSSVLLLQFPESPLSHLGGRQVHRYCNGLGSFVENLVSYVFLVLLCLHTHCRPLDHLQGKTGLILCRFLSTTVLNNWLFEVSALPLSIYSSTLLTRSKGGLALTVLLEHVLGFLLGKPFFLVFGT